MKTVFVCAAVIFLLSSCVSTRKIKNESVEGTQFYSENTSELFKSELKNGIPVIVKNIPSEKNITFTVIFTGGSSVSDPALEGLEALALNVIASESSAHSSSEMEKIYISNNVFISKYVGNDFSRYAFTCPSENFFTALDVFQDTLVSTGFSLSTFVNVLSQEEDDSLADSEDARQLLMKKVSGILYKNHPYGIARHIPAGSYIDESDVKQYIPLLVNAYRMKIIVTGNVEKIRFPVYDADPDEVQSKATGSVKVSGLIFEELEKRFSAIKSVEIATPDIPSLNFTVNGDGIEKLTLRENAAESCMVMCFPCPSRSDSDYQAFVLASMVVESILYKDISGKSQVAASTGTGFLNGKKCAVAIIADGLENASGLKLSGLIEKINASLETFPSDENLEKNLQRYKNIYIGRIYKHASDSRMTALQIASSLIYSGIDSVDEFYARPEKINGITAQEVRTAFEKYFCNENHFTVICGNRKFLKSMEG